MVPHPAVFITLGEDIAPTRCPPLEELAIRFASIIAFICEPPQQQQQQPFPSLNIFWMPVEYDLHYHGNVLSLLKPTIITVGDPPFQRIKGIDRQHPTGLASLKSFHVMIVDGLVPQMMDQGAQATRHPSFKHVL